MTLRRAGLVPRWVTLCGYTVLVHNPPPRQLSLPLCVLEIDDNYGNAGEDTASSVARTLGMLV